MKVLFNASTNIVGGAVQTATNFILQAIKDHSIDWFFIISKKIADELTELNVDIINEHFFVINPSPSKNFKSRYIVKTIEKKN